MKFLIVVHIYNIIKISLSEGCGVMVYEKAKLFWKVNGISKDVFCVNYDDSKEYYAFLKQCHDKGYRQIIITSEIMVGLIKYYVLEKGLSVYDIQFMEEDQDLTDEVSNLLTLISKNGIFLGKLIEKLNFLSEKSSIDIHRIYFKGRNSENVAVNFYLQSNGIIGIDKKNYSFISDEIGNLIERCLFQ